MSYYVRKINRAKWNEAENLKNEEDINKLNADYLSTCLKTQQGEISLWKIEKKEELDDVVVAITSVGEYISKVDVVLLDENDLDKISIKPIKQPEGNSKIKDKHHKVENLNYEKIGKIAKIILHTIKNKNDNVKRISVPNVKRILLNAIEKGELKLPKESNLLKELGISA